MDENGAETDSSEDSEEYSDMDLACKLGHYPLGKQSGRMRSLTQTGTGCAVREAVSRRSRITSVWGSRVTSTWGTRGAMAVRTRFDAART
jgi:hypothetical protein